MLFIHKGNKTTEEITLSLCFSFVPFLATPLSCHLTSVFFFNRLKLMGVMACDVQNTELHNESLEALTREAARLKLTLEEEKAKLNDKHGKISLTFIF